MLKVPALAMRVDSPFRLPYDPPQVSWRLEQKLADYTAGMFRIDLQVERDGGWKKINALQLAREPSREDGPLLAALVMACAERHAERYDRPRYRVIAWRRVGVEKERRVTTFTAPQLEPPLQPRSPGWWRKQAESKLGRAWAGARKGMLAAEEVERALAAEVQRRRAAEQAEQAETGLRLIVGNYLLGLTAADDETRVRAQAEASRILGLLEQACDPRVFVDLCRTIPSVLRGLRSQVIAPQDVGHDGTVRAIDGGCPRPWRHRGSVLQPTRERS